MRLNKTLISLLFMSVFTFTNAHAAQSNDSCGSTTVTIKGQEQNVTDAKLTSCKEDVMGQVLNTTVNEKDIAPSLYNSVGEKGSIIEKDEVYRSAMTIEVFKESLEVLEKEASVSHNASVRKNFRVDRHAYNNFKEQKNKKYGKRSKVNPYLCERLRELRLLRTEYKEDKSFHSELSNCLAILNELTTNENFEMLVASNSKRFTEPAFINIYNTLVKIYKIIKYRKEINDSTST